MKALICATLILLSSCTTKPVHEVSLNEGLLPDGTWVIDVRVSCELTDLQSCRERIKKLIHAHATNLCAATPNQIYDCKEREESDRILSVTCSANCH